MKILALDQSTRVTGWSVFADGTLQEYGKFDAENAGADIGKRLTYIREKVTALINKYDIQKVLIEEIQLQNSRNNLHLGSNMSVEGQQRDENGKFTK